MYICSGVKYPKMYATGDDQDSNTFNCIQRSHQNSSETIGPVMVMQALLGLYHPITAASLGVAWAIGESCPVCGCPLSLLYSCSPNPPYGFQHGSYDVPNKRLPLALRHHASAQRDIRQTPD